MAKKKLHTKKTNSLKKNKKKTIVKKKKKSLAKTKKNPVKSKSKILKKNILMWLVFYIKKIS